MLHCGAESKAAEIVYQVQDGLGLLEGGGQGKEAGLMWGREHKIRTGELAAG